MNGNLIIADQTALRIRSINLGTGTISGLAGTGYLSHGPDCVPAKTEALGDLNNAVMDASGILYFNDQLAHRIRMVIPDNAKPSVQISASATTICAGANVNSLQQYNRDPQPISIIGL